MDCLPMEGESVHDSTSISLDEVVAAGISATEVEVFRDGRELEGLPIQNKHSGFSSISEGLRWRSRLQPDTVCYTWVESESNSVDISCREFYDQAFNIAAALIMVHNLRKGEPVILCYEPGLEFVFSFWGVVLAGGIAVPVYPPHPSRLARGLEGLSHIIDNVRAQYFSSFSAGESQRDSIILTSSSVNRLRQWSTVKSLGTAKWPQGVKWVVSSKLKKESKAIHSVVVPTARREDVCFLQFTSGSTSDPKGVVVTHGCLLVHGVALDERLLNFRSVESIGTVYGVSFLPQYHDMGLIAFIIEIGIFHSGHVVVMSPISFIQKPYLWLQTMSKYANEYVCTGAPNFAYELCLRKITDEQLKTLDLRGIRFCLNAAEPIRSETILAFSKRFGVCGFSPDSWACSYGLAESTLITTGSVMMPNILRVDANSLENQKKIRVIEETDEVEGVSIRNVVSCGTPTFQSCLAIVDTSTNRTIDDGFVGEIWVHSPFVCRGYWGEPRKSAETFGAELAEENDTYQHRIHWWGQYDRNHLTKCSQAATAPCGRGPFLRTGDLGFWFGDYLYVTGRLKDMIIVRGRNIYPHDIERVAEQGCGQLRPGCSAAFSTGCDSAVVLVAEVRDGVSSSTVDSLLREIQSAVLDGTEVQLDDLVLIPPRSISKTTSGKIKRYKCRELYETNRLKVFGRAGSHTKDQRPSYNSRLNNDTKPIISIDQMRTDLKEHVERLQSVRDSHVGHNDSSVQDSALQLLRGLLPRLENTDEKSDLLVSSVSMETSMQDLGMDSIRATTLAQEFSELLQVHLIPVSMVFQCHSVSDFLQGVVRWVRVSGYTPDRVLHLMENGHVDDARDMLTQLLHHELSILGVTVPSGDSGMTPTDTKSTVSEESMHVSLSCFLEESGEAVQQIAVLQRLNVLFGDVVVPIQSEEDRKMVLSLTLGGLVDFIIRNITFVVEKGQEDEEHSSLAKPPSRLKETARRRSVHSVIVQLLAFLYLPFLVLLAGYPAYRLLLSVHPFFQGFFTIGIFPVTFSAATVAADDRVLDILLYVPCGYILFGLSLTLVLVVHKWVLIGRYRPGSFPLFGSMYLRWWFVTVLFRFTDYVVFQFIRDTVLLNFIYKCLGARISLSARVSSPISPLFDLVSIGAGSRINGFLQAHHVSHGKLTMGSIIIGGFVELRKACVVAQGVEIGDNCTISELSVILPGTRVSPNQIWSGNPGTLHNTTDHPPAVINITSRIIEEVLKWLGLVLIAYTYVASGIPAYLAMSTIYTSTGTTFRYARLALSLFGYGVHLTTFCIWVIVLKWVLVGKVREGDSHDDPLGNKWRSWFVRTSFQLCYVFWLSNFGKSLVPVLVYKALGARVSLTAIINEANLTNDWDMLEMEDRSFVSTANIDATDPETGCMCPVHFSERGWLGIRSVVRGRLHVDSSGGVGPHTFSPSGTNVRKGEVSFGVPATTLPASVAESESSLHESRRLLVHRVLQLMLLPALMFAYAFLTFIPGIEYTTEILKTVSLADTGDDFIALLALSPAYLIVFCAFTFLYAFHERILFCPRFPSGRYAWTSATVSRWAIAYFGIDVLYQRYFSPLLSCGSFAGNLVLSLRGATIPSSVYVESPEVAMDPPSLTMGEGVSINQGVLLIGHNANSEQVNFGEISIGHGSTIWAHASCLPPMSIEDGAELLFISKSVDGMILRSCQSYGGVPCRQLQLSRLSRKYSQQFLLDGQV